MSENKNIRSHKENPKNSFLIKSGLHKTSRLTLPNNSALLHKKGEKIENSKVNDKLQRQMSPKEIIPRPNILIKTGVSSFLSEKKVENDDKGENRNKLESQIENSLRDMKKLNTIIENLTNENKEINELYENEMRINKSLIDKNSNLKDEIKKLKDEIRERCDYSITKLKEEMEKNIIYRKEIRDLRDQLADKNYYITNTLLNQQREMESMKNLILLLRLQAQTSSSFLLPLFRISNPLGGDNVDPDNMSYEQLLNLQDRIGYVERGFTKEQIKKIEKITYNQETHVNEDLCAVCYCNYEYGEKLRRLTPCTHIYHSKCIKEWLLKEKNCPVCKTDVIINE